MPYGPWSTDRSGELMASGITGGIKDLMEGYQRGQEEKKRLIQGAKAAEAMMKTFPDLPRSLGMSLEDFGALSAEEKIGTAAGAIHGWTEKQKSETEGLQRDRLRSGIETDKTMQNYHRSQMALMADRQRAMAAQDEEDAAVGEGLRNFAVPPPAQVNAGGVTLDAGGSFMDQPDTYDAAMKRALSVPGLGRRGGGKLAEILLRNQPKPEKTKDNRMLPMLDPDGKPIPRGLINPNTGFGSFVPEPKPKKAVLSPKWLTGSDEEFINGINEVEDSDQQADLAKKRLSILHASGKLTPKDEIYLSGIAGAEYVKGLKESAAARLDAQRGGKPKPKDGKSQPSSPVKIDWGAAREDFNNWNQNR